MKLTKKMIPAAVAATIFAGAMGTTSLAQAEGEVAASLAISNMYLWRGQDLGAGDGVVSGDLSYSNSGFHTGVWASSGDSANGQEYDLWLGYGGEAGDFTYDISVWNYIYPSTNVDFKELSEVILTVGYGAFSASYYDNVAGDAGYSMLTLGGGFDKYSATLGIIDQEDADLGGGVTQEQNYMYLDLSYAFNDNLSFTVSQIIDDDADDSVIELPDDPHVQISYSISI